MIRNFVIKYIPKITKQDIVSFAEKQKVSLSNQEIDLIFKAIKEDYEVLLSPNYEVIFSKYKKDFSKETYEKIHTLFLEYAKMYKIF